LPEKADLDQIQKGEHKSLSVSVSHTWEFNI
jgi:hypothetical protein